MKVTIELKPEQAAGLLRFADKVNHPAAASVLYAHVSAEIREEQVFAILDGFRELHRALADAGVQPWPWVETGSVQ